MVTSVARATEGGAIDAMAERAVCGRVGMTARAREGVVARWRRFLGVCLTLLFWMGPATAQAAPTPVPPDLEPWVPWVLEGLGDDACTRAGDGQRVCAWLGHLEVTVEAGGARFALDVLTERKVAVPLPGSKTHWPLDVESADGALVVLPRADDTPWVELPAGSHRVTGRFRWRKRPDVLPVAASLARVVVKTGQATLHAPRREATGGVWLEGADAPEPEEEAPEAVSEPDRLSVEVSRKIDDGVPLVITTHIRLRVGGRAREIRLDNPLLPGGVLLSLDSGNRIASRLEADGVLVLALKKGEHRVVLKERHAAMVDQLQLPKRAAPWPESEVWVWKPDVALRQTEVSGGAAIDPSQTSMPKGWRQHRAFRLRAPARMVVKTSRRGDPSPAPNKLSLSRKVWVDLDGAGYTVRDSLRGDMQRDWRLRFTGPGVLGNVQTHGRDQLITVDGDAAARGVEVRSERVNIDAEWRGQGAPAALPAVGWSTDVQKLDVQVSLPPGWELLGARGADEVWPNRLDRWEALDILWVLAIALAVGKLGRWSWAPIAAVAMALAHELDAAPFYTWGVVLALVALLRRVGPGRIRTLLRVTRGVVGLVLAAQLATVVAAEGDRSLFRHEDHYDAFEAQLEKTAIVQADNREGGTGTRAKGEEGSMGSPHRMTNNRYGVRGPADGTDPAAARQAALKDAAEFGMIGMLNSGAGGKSGKKRKFKSPWGRDDALAQQRQQVEQQAKQDPNAVVQTGHGVPKWNHGTARLTWLGPVEANHQLRLYLLPPWARSALGAAGALLLLWLGWVLHRRTSTEARPSPGHAGSAGASALLATCVGLGALGFAPEASAAPRQELLDELKKRLTRDPDCAPNCVAVGAARLVVDDRGLRYRAEVHVGATTSLALPGPASTWVPRDVRVDGKPSRALALLGSHLHLRLPAGHHVVEIAGAVPGRALTLALGTHPHRLEVAAKGWAVDGVDEDGKAEPQIQLSRTGNAPAPEGTPGPALEKAAPSGTEAPPWLAVQRSLDAGVLWSMRTVVRRASATGKPIVVRFPLLPGEKVVDSSFPQEGRELVITFDRDRTEAAFQSAIESADSLTFQAPKDRPWSETWKIGCSELWRCDMKGIAPVRHLSRGIWLPVYRPWPGEALTVAFRRPKAAKGRSTTVDDARLALEPRERVTEATLEVWLRSSTGGLHHVTIPSGVRVTSVKVNGKKQPGSASGGKIPLAIEPGGSYAVVKWQQPGGIKALFRGPAVNVGDQIANAKVRLLKPRKRWWLWAGGPRWGPTFRVWGYVLLLGLLGVVVARGFRAPIAAGPLAGLLVGYWQLPPIVVPVGIGWFFLVEARRRWTLERRAHNLAQLACVFVTGLFVLTLAAALYAGLVKRPRMMIGDGHGGWGGGTFEWYVDRTAGDLPRPWIVSVPVWLYRLVTVAWAAWAGRMLLPWAQRAWEAFATGGLWRRKALAGAAGALEGAGEVAAAADTGSESETEPDSETDSDAEADTEPGTGDEGGPEEG